MSLVYESLLCITYDCSFLFIASTRDSGSLVYQSLLCITYDCSFLFIASTRDSGVIGLSVTVVYNI